MPDKVELVHCPNCPDQGWYAIGSNEDGWEQVPCEFCYTVPNSYFNALQQSVEPTEGEAGEKNLTVWRSAANADRWAVSCKRSKSWKKWKK